MRLELGHISLELQAFGAMVTGGRFRMPDGSVAEPLFAAPWRGEPAESPADPLIQNLGAEWPCVPFGVAEIPDGLPADWRAGAAADWNRSVHGHCSNAEWSLKQVSEGEARAAIDYPGCTPIRRLERTIRLDPKRTAIHFRLEISARRRARIAVGLHPVFDLAGCGPGSCALSVAGRTTAWSFPAEVEPGRGRFRPDQRGVPLEAISDRQGTAIDGSRLPLDSETEDLLLLTEPGGEVSLSYLERGYRAAVRWNPEDLPSCSLWYSNGGRQFPPWNGRVRAIGIEPVAAAFDLGQGLSLSAETPLAKRNIATSVEIGAGDPWTTDYSIIVEPLGGEAAGRQSAADRTPAE